MRQKINLYKNPRYQDPEVEEPDMDSEVDDDVPEIALAELLEGLEIECEPANIPVPDSDDDL